MRTAMRRESGSKLPVFAVAWLLLGAAAPGRAHDGSVEAQLEDAMEARYRSPAEARMLNAALRERLRAEPRPAIEAQTWLNECLSLIEEDARAALEAAAAGKRVLEASGRDIAALRGRLEVCELQAREYLGEISESLAGYDGIVALAAERNDPLLEADARLARGELRSYVGRFARGLEDLRTACRIYTAHGAENDALYCLQAIATLYVRLEDHAHAIEYLDEVIPERRRRGQTHMLGDALYNLGRALEGQGKLVEARERYEEAREISEQLGSPAGVAYAHQALGTLLLRQGKHSEALELLDEALVEFRRLGDPDMIARVQCLRGHGLFKLGRIDLAFEAARESVALYREIDQAPGLEKATLLLAEIEMHQGRHEEAARTLLAAREVHLRLDRLRRDELLAQQRAGFDAEKKEQEVRLLRAERELAERERNVATRIDRMKSLVIGLTIALLTVAGGFLLRQFRLARRLHVLALVDELTGIANRRSVLAFLDEQVRLHRHGGKPLSVILLDIDHFKRLNDAHGHAAGDAALRAIARACQQLLRGQDKLGRTGGEEFLAVLPDASLAHAGEVAERICDQVRQLSLDAIAPGLRVSISAGVSEWRPQDSDAQAVVQRADTALYEAKQRGRDRVCLRAA